MLLNSQILSGFFPKIVYLPFILPFSTDSKIKLFFSSRKLSIRFKISPDSNIFNAISNEASAENRNGILKSYDYLLNNKYKVIVNEKTLDRVKNYFR